MPAAPVVDAPPVPPADRERRRSWPFLRQAPVSLLIVAVPIVVGAVRLVATLHRPFTAGGDVAFIELTIRDALHGRVSLGPYSRFGWHHLGPAVFYLFAPLYALSGHSSRSLFLDAWLLNSGCAVGIVLLVRRGAGEVAARLAAAVFCLYIGAVAFGTLINPWNPSLLAMPLVLMLTAVALAATGSAWALVVAAASGSYLVQTHLGTAPIVGIALVAGFIAWWFRNRRDPVPWRKPLVAGGLLLGLLWVAPLAQQVFGTDGNLTRVVRFYASPPASAGVNGHALHPSAQIVANYATVVPFGNPDLVTRHHRGAAAAGWAALGVVVGALAWRRHRFIAWLALATPVSLVVAVLAATRVIGALERYLFQWTEALTVPVIMATLALLVTVAGRLAPRAGPLIGGVTLVVGVLASVAATGVIVHADIISYGDSPEARQVAARIEDAIGHDRSKVIQINVVQQQFVDGPILLELAKQGYQFRLTPVMDLYAGTTSRPANGPTFALRSSAAAGAPLNGTHLITVESVDVWQQAP